MRIIATIRRIDEKYDFINKIEMCISCGIDLLRINLAKSKNIDRTANDIELIRHTFGGSNIQLMLDIPYPGCKIRVELSQPIEIRKNTKYLFACNENNCDNCIIMINNRNKELFEGDEIIYNDGEGVFTVNKKYNSNLYEFVSQNNFLLYNGKSLSPYYEVTNQYDLSSIKEIAPEYLALSFINDGDQVNTVKQTSFFPNSKIISKIETQSALNRLDNILDYSDGVMIARGDLAMNIKGMDFNSVQKNIRESALRKNKLCYIATDILQSMISHPFPSRSDITDIGFIKNLNPDGIILSLQLSTSDNMEQVFKWTEIQG